MVRRCVEGARLAVITKGYPRLSETFVTQELAALEACGCDFIIYALRRPTDEARHAMHDRITAPCFYLPEYIRDDLWRALRAFAFYMVRPVFYRALWLWLGDFCRDTSANRARRFAQAVILAYEMPRSIRHIYFHFIHTPGSVAYYTAILRGINYSGSAHAKDIWTSAVWDLRRKLRGAAWCVTCTESGYDYLRSVAGAAADRVHLVYHGLDISDFPQPSSWSVPADAGDGDLCIVSVGRLVEKKGYDRLLRALALLPPQGWRFYHIGGGDIGFFRRLAEDLGIGERVEFMGEGVRSRVVSLLARADIFTLASLVATDGDRDGIPNVLMEALWMGVPVLAGDLPSVRELIIDEESGLLCDARDEVAFAARLRRLLQDAELRRRLAAGGVRRMREKFLFRQNFTLLRSLFSADLFDDG